MRELLREILSPEAAWSGFDFQFPGGGELALIGVKRVKDKAAAKRTEAFCLRAQARADFLGAIFS